MDMSLSKFQILLMLRIFRPDRVLNAMRHFIVDFFAQNTHYVQPPTIDFEKIYK
jgi:dynein heavy chain